MNGRAARRARKEATYLLDMYEVFTATLSDMMKSYGVDFGRCDKGTVKDTIGECCGQYGACHDMLIEWVEEEEE